VHSCQNGISVYSVNIQCLLARVAELEYQLEMHRPHIVLIQETWLNNSVHDVQISGYEVVSRRDRKEKENRGGILTLQRDDFNGLVHISNSESEERSWHFLRLGCDTILFANWYRPGATEHDAFQALYDEMGKYYSEVSGVFLAGDLNVHHKKWLKYSSGDTEVGADLKTFCDFHNLSQLVREPTRNDYLLDLVLTDIPKCSSKVMPYIADHRGVMVKLPTPEVLERSVAREVWILKKANWRDLEDDLGKYNWQGLSEDSAESALEHFLEVLWLHLVKHIPRTQVTNKKSTHPWLNEKCRAAIRQKNAAEGTERFKEASKQCTNILNEERAAWVRLTKTKLAKLPRSSKRWWRLNRELLHRKANVVSIPTLRQGTEWLSDAASKANAFAHTFSSKSELPEESVDTPFFGVADVVHDSFFALRSRKTKRLLKELDENTATGHDKISASILKCLAACLAVPFTKVVRRLFHEGCWPKVWKYHLIVPIFKKGSAFQPGNYRGVHLTAILSKIAERLVGFHLVPFLQRSAFGSNQWAFTTGLGARDLITMLMLSWILEVCLGRKIGAYLSDISGAFDKVFKPYLLAKLQGYGVGETCLRFLDSYLSPRVGRVVVQGQFSDAMRLANTVFQGTVLGPPLWNTFFADVATPASSTGGKEAMFADDLNVFKAFDRHVPVADVNADLEKCRARTHRWGKTNRVSFDPSKEFFAVLHPSAGHGPCFKLLGCMVDTDLRMETCIGQLLVKIRSKITAILRTRGFYNIPDLVSQFKTHVWGLIEVNIGGYFHAASSLLEKIDHAQNRFFHELGLTAAQALLDFNAAPPRLRRNIAALGLLHKRVIGKCHPAFERLFPWYSERFDEGRGMGHNKQLYSHWVEISAHRSLYNRSIFAMADVYNNLPQHVVDATSVNIFQNYLMQIARTRCQQGDAAWASTFCRRVGGDI